MESLRSKVSASCDALGTCWDALFPELKKNLKDSVGVIDAFIREYELGFQKKMEKASLYDLTEPGSEEQKLLYQAQLIQQALDECDDLRDGPSQPRHIIVIGRGFNQDGRNFELAGMTAYRDILNRECGKDNGSEVYRECRRHIIVKTDVEKGDLLNYLHFLGPDSVKSLTYFGHGTKDGMLIGPRNLLLPAKWDRRLTVNEDEWHLKNSGVLYNSDLTKHLLVREGFERELWRVMPPGAPVKLFACNIGQGIAEKVKEVMGNTSVFASLGPMSFEYVDSTGKWVKPGPKGLPRDVKDVRLVADRPKDFQEMKFFPTMRLKGAGNGETRFSQAESRDHAARDISMRLALGSSDEALVDRGRNLITFTEKEQSRLAKILGSRFHAANHDQPIDPDFAYRDLSGLFAGEIKKASPEDAEKLKRLLSKIDLAIDESVRTYYNPQ